MSAVMRKRTVSALGLLDAIEKVSPCEFWFHSCSAGATIAPAPTRRITVALPMGTRAWRGFFLEVTDPRVAGLLDDERADNNLGDSLVLLAGTAPQASSDGPWPAASATNRAVLDLTPGNFRLLYPHQYTHPISQSFFFADERWTFFVERLTGGAPPITYRGMTRDFAAIDAVRARFFARSPNETVAVSKLSFATGPAIAVGRAFTYTNIVPMPIAPLPGNPSYRFYTFCHPRVCDFLRRLDAGGLGGLLHWNTTNPVQDASDVNPTFFKDRYAPEPTVVDMGSLPLAGVEFSAISPYGEDNQNIFLYCVLRGAAALTAAGQFTDAEWLLQSVFDPADGSAEEAPRRFWKYKPFHDADPQLLVDFLALLNQDGDAAAAARAAVADWLDHPFKPWRVARNRPTALMKTAVRYYIENLLAQADQDYARASDQEMLLRAAATYIRALEILGPSQEPLVPSKQTSDTGQALSYEDLEGDPTRYRFLPDALENVLPVLPGLPTSASDTGPDRFPFTLSTRFAFCLPHDDTFDKLRRRAQTKLAGIRAGLDFDGHPQQFSVFGQRIDPMLLVRAAAAGVDLTTAMGAAQAPRPVYRFSVLLQKAKEFCGELRTTSASLLAALTEDAAESLAELRADHEIALLSAIQKVKEQARQEAEESLAGLNNYLAVVKKRNKYYSSRTLMNAGEIVGIELTAAATILQAVAQGISLTAGGVKEIPNFTVGVSGIMGSPYVVVTEGGGNIGDSLSEASTALNMLGTILHAGAGLSSTIAGYQRRKDEWDMMAETTALEIEQVSSQIAAQQARLDAATEDLNVLKQQQDDAQAVRDFLANRFNNADLRQYRIAQLSSVSHQAYLVAFAMAKSAERAFQFERGYFDGANAPEQQFIQFGYWQNNVSGVTAAEQLGTALQQLEAAYLDQNRRDYEVTKYISLAITNPLALEALRRTGTTGLFTLSEDLFARDYPECYNLRIKSLRVTIPCVTSSFTTVPCKVALSRYRIRLNDDLDPPNTGYERKQPPDARFYDSIGTVEAMYTSTGREDAGLHAGSESDGRLRWFEGAGAADSEFEVSFPFELAQFPAPTITDVVFEMQLTFRAGGELFRNAAVEHLKVAQQDGYQMFRARNEFPTEWSRFINPQDVSTDHVLQLPITVDRLPFAVQGRSVTLTDLLVILAWRRQPAVLVPVHARVPPAGELAESKPSGETADLLRSMRLQLLGFDAKNAPIPASTDAAVEPPSIRIDAAEVPPELQPEYTIEVMVDGQSVKRIRPDAIEDIAILCHYQAVPQP